MSYKSGKDVFTSYKGTEYIISKYLSSGDVTELKDLNDGFHDKKFEDFLLTRLSYGAGSRFIPDNYNDEVVQYAKSKVGSNIETKRFKTKDEDVDVLRTYEGKEVYSDNYGNLREFGTGRFTKAID